MKPRVAILSAFLTPFRSGAEACAEEVPLRLTEQFDFVIITARLRRDVPKDDVLCFRNGDSQISATRTIPVKRVGFGFWFDKWLYPFLAPREAKKYYPHIVHAILETFAGEALMRSKKWMPNAKRVLTLQTTNRTFRKKKILQSPDIVTAISKHLAGIAYDLGRNDVTVIPNGIDYHAIQLAHEKHAKVPGRILFVGRLEHMKGVDTLLVVFATLQSQHQHAQCAHESPAGGAYLHIVGDGSQREALENLAQKLGIADRVMFRGYLPAPDVYKEYAEAEIFCGLSRSEGLGNVFLEAQAAGCIVVATNVGGIPEIVCDQNTGVLVAPDDVDAAAHALEAFTEECAKQAFAKNAIAHAANYDWNLVANRYAEIYKSFTLPEA